MNQWRSKIADHNKDKTTFDIKVKKEIRKKADGFSNLDLSYQC